MTFRSALLSLCAVALSACNCGRGPVLTKTEASLSLSVDALDFGPVTEGTSKGLRFRVDNVGRAPVGLVVVLAAGSSEDFTLGAVPVSLEAGGFIEVPVTFTPHLAGEDQGLVNVSSDKPGETPLEVALHGGPIEPSLSFDPDPLDFRPSASGLETRTVQLKSVGLAGLTVRSVGVVLTSNPDFAVVRPALPVRLLPGEALGVQVEYARSQRSAVGLLEVQSDDADAGTRVLQLLPDPPPACRDGVDNDGDFLADFPADPGCQSADDGDESNAGVCVPGGSQPCGGSAGVCPGTRACDGGAWDSCVPTRTPVPEVCGNGVDDNCDGTTDEGCAADGGCSPDGIFNIDGGPLTYYCCFGLVDLQVSQVQLLSTGKVAICGPAQPGGQSLTSLTATSCPSGSFDVSRTLTGNCNETYRLQGTFTGPNSFAGTYTATYTGSSCDCYGIDTPCTNQTFSFTATR